MDKMEHLSRADDNSQLSILVVVITDLKQRISAGVIILMPFYMHTKCAYT